MAGTSLLALIDDITTILDDVAAMTKVATKKTAGVLGDDLALNAEQVTGVDADRELPVVWAVAKGSAVNKLILVPSALAISAFAPWAVTPLLMAGGAFLCFEGFEKLVEKAAERSRANDGAAPVAPEASPAATVEAAPKASHAAAPAGCPTEAEKIKGAVRTDFILSAEIIVISLGTIATAPLGKQVATLTAVAVLMTIGVYGLVAGIVKLDDAGLALRARGGAAKTVGEAILRAAPWLMKGLSVAGTAAMFLVGGGIVAHGLPGLHGLSQRLETAGGVTAATLPTLLNAVVGLLTGALIVGVVTAVKRLRGAPAAAH